MWLKRLTQNELGSIDKFNRSMSLLGAVPQRKVPTYQAQTPTQIAAGRRRRTVLALSSATVLGSAISIVTGIWFLMAVPAILLFSFFAVAWRAITTQETHLIQNSRPRLNVSRFELAAKAKEWSAAPTVIPNRVVGDSVPGLTGQQMLDLAAAQTAEPAEVNAPVAQSNQDEDLILNIEPDKKSAAG